MQIQKKESNNQSEETILTVISAAEQVSDKIINLLNRGYFFEEGGDNP